MPGGPVDKNPPASAGDKGSIPGPGRSHILRSNSARVPELLSPKDLKLTTERGTADERRGMRDGQKWNCSTGLYPRWLDPFVSESLGFLLCEMELRITPTIGMLYR